jgi:putative DNA primase/helicase
VKRFALVAAAGELAIQFGIVPWPEKAAFNAARMAFEAWLAERGAGPAEIRNAIHQIKDLLGRYGSSHFEPVGVADTFRPHERWGWSRVTDDEREFCILPGVWKNTLCNGFDPTLVASALAERGALARGPDGKFSIVVKIDRLSRRLYVVSTRKLEALNE